MPTITARGLEGESSADAASVVEEEDPVTKYLADSEGNEDDEAIGASTSVGGLSSSRTAPEENVLDISSGDEEDFLVAPSHPNSEGGEEERGEGGQKAGVGRSDGCSKKRHDKPVGSPAGTPSKRKAEAAPGGASGGGIASRLRRSM